jgi:hypothetical protein
MRAKTEQVSAQMRIAIEVIGERERQDLRHGGPIHDDTLTPFDFLFLIRDKTVTVQERKVPFRRALLECAALAVAGIEMIDRKAYEERAAQLGAACSSGPVAEAAIAAGLAGRLSPRVVRYLNSTDSAYWAAFSRFAAILTQAPASGEPQ